MCYKINLNFIFMVTFMLFFLLGYFLTKQTNASGCCLGGCLLSIIGLFLIFSPVVLYFLTEETWIRVLGLLVWLIVYWHYKLPILLCAILGWGIGFLLGGAFLGSIIGACLALLFSIKNE